jgi:SHS2 domain-containing protein
MSYEYLDHEADVGIRAYGGTLAEAFCDGAKAMFNVMADVERIQREQSVSVQCEAESVASLFVEWLNALIAQADIAGMLFCDFEATIKENDDGFTLTGEAWGEEIDADKHDLHTEVKAATYSGLSYEKKGKNHIVQCIVDV